MMQQMQLFNPVSYPIEKAEKSDLLEKLVKLLNLYDAGELGGTSHEVHPTLDNGSTENYLYFTLASAINFQRKSETLWQSALYTYNDLETNFVFSPAIVSETEEEKTCKALTKHKLALQKNKHTSIWLTLCRTLYNNYEGDPKKLLESCNYDVVEVISLLSRRKDWFPYLSGPKLSNYWLYILLHFTDIKLKNRQEISIIPDIHIIRATQYLGLIPSESAKPEQVAKIWKDLLSGTDLVPSDLHAPLWRWSRRGFKPDL